VSVLNYLEKSQKETEGIAKAIKEFVGIDVEECKDERSKVSNMSFLLRKN
jgi:hypothetical protein